MTTRKKIESTVKNWLATEVINEDDVVAAKVLLAAMNIGPNADRIAKFVGVPRSQVREIGTRMRASEIWTDGRVEVEAIGQKGREEDGDMEFLLHIGVARGLIRRHVA